LEEILQILDQYPLSIRNVTFVQEDVFKVETFRGDFCLKRGDKRQPKMLFIYSVLQHLINSGFKKVSAPVPTKNNDPLVVFKDEVYLLTKWVPGISCDFRRDRHLAAAARTLAEFHLVSRGVDVLPGGKARVMYWKWPEIFKKRINDLRFFRQLVEGKNVLTDFEKRFLKYADYFISMGEKAWQVLMMSAYEKIARDAENEHTFTHRDVAARNFIIHPDGEAYLIDFDYCRYDVRVTDMVRLIERTLKDFKWDMAKADFILGEYNKMYPLEQEQYLVMLAFFLFPQKFWRISDRYFRKPKRWQEEGYLKKISSVTRKLERKERFVEEFKKKYCSTGG